MFHIMGGLVLVMVIVPELFATLIPVPGVIVLIDGVAVPLPIHRSPLAKFALFPVPPLNIDNGVKKSEVRIDTTYFSSN